MSTTRKKRLKKSYRGRRIRKSWLNQGQNLVINLMRTKKVQATGSPTSLCSVETAPVALPKLPIKEKMINLIRSMGLLPKKVMETRKNSKV